SPTAAFGAPVAIAELNGIMTNDASPSLTSDELTLVFESDRAGGLGGSDLWIATRTSRTGFFGPPQALMSVNSSARDANPEISSDGRTLYFESERAGGKGGADIWVTTRETNTGSFGPAMNFGAVNTAGIESHPSVSADTQNLYFSSDRAGGTATAGMWRTRLQCD